MTNPERIILKPSPDFTGSGVFSCRDAAGNLFLCYSSRNPEPFGSRLVRITPDGRVRQLPVPNNWHPRPSFSLEPDGLYMTYQTNDSGDSVNRYKVPGFVAYGAGGGGGVTEQQVRDIAWSLVPDAVYADLQAKGGIYGMIRAIVDEALTERKL
jgi:hypothetical protein